MLLSFMTLYQPTVLKKWFITKLKRLCIRKVSSLSPRPRPEIILKDAWQVQREDYHQRGTSTERPVSDEGKMEPKIDFRIQGIPNTAVEQDEDDRIPLIRRAVHQVKNHPNKDALFVDLPNNGTYNPFSEES